MFLSRSVKLSDGSQRGGGGVDPESIPVCGVNLANVSLAEEAGQVEAQSAFIRDDSSAGFTQNKLLIIFGPNSSEGTAQPTSEVTLEARAAGFFSAFMQLDNIITEHFLCRHKSPDEFLFLPRVSVSADIKRV